jgi:UDP-GlcNAc3NAcA epimerase
MKKLLTIVGARPQFIKASAVSRVLASEYGGRVEELVLHTGQHHDASLSAVFFEELGLAEPRFRLTLSSDAPVPRMGEMLCGIEQVLGSYRFDAVLVYGDTDSTLAGALAAAKSRVPLIHVEAGLRSYDRTQPEEQNRVVVDHLSQVLNCPTEESVRNLQREGVGGRIIRTGDIMLDNALHFLPIARQRKEEWWRALGIKDGPYVLATVHRACNTDSPDRLADIMRSLLTLSETVPVVLPLHPRTRKAIENVTENSLQHRFAHCSSIRLLPPVSYLELLLLLDRCSVVVTDSGGVQKEAYFLRRPSVVLRDATEWVDNVRQGVSSLADAVPGVIVSQVRHFLDHAPSEGSYQPLYGNGHAAEELLSALDL